VMAGIYATTLERAHDFAGRFIASIAS
jgi:hypothetical protein